MAGFTDAIGQAKQFWASRSGKQKTYLLAGAGATLGLLALFVRLIGTPDYKPLFTGLEPADAQTLTAQLDAQGIPHQASADGKTISVPADKLDAARLQTATNGNPHSGRLGFELFDKMSWGQTEFDEKVAYQRAIEGELERTIQTLSGVDSARVHLVMATDSVFLDRQRGAKASVILKLKRDGLSKDAVLAISRLVAGAVDQLRPEDVSIVDAATDRSLSMNHDGSDGGEGLESTLAQRLIATLEPVVGTNKIRASVNVDYDHASTEESQEKYDPTVSAVLSVQKTDDQATGGTIPVGVPGTSSNTPSPKQAKDANINPSHDSLQKSTTENAQYGVNRTVTHRVEPAGKIQRVTAAILVDDAVVTTSVKGKTSYTTHKRTPEEMAKIQELAKAVVGFKSERGDTISVQNMSFDSPPTDSDLAAPKWTEQLHKVSTESSSILRPVSLLALFILVYFLVIRPVQKQALAPGQLAQNATPELAGGARTERLTAGSMEFRDDAQKAAHLKEETIELIKQKPTNTARAVQAWLREEPS